MRWRTPPSTGTPGPPSPYGLRQSVLLQGRFTEAAAVFGTTQAHLEAFPDPAVLGDAANGESSPAR